MSKRGPYARRMPDIDRKFESQAPCVRHELGNDAWTAEYDRTYTIGVMEQIPGTALQEMARQVCFTCPVQWECTGAAYLANECWGVWGDYIENLQKFFRRYPADGGVLEVLEMAKSTGTPVQVLVQSVLQDIA